MPGALRGRARLRGRHKLLRTGKRQIPNVVLPGEIIGLPGSFFERFAYSVMSHTDMEVQVFKLNTLLDLCDRRPNLALSLLWLSAAQRAIYAEHISDVGHRTPLERLAHFLLEMHARLMAVGRATEKTFEMPLSQENHRESLGAQRAACKPHAAPTEVGASHHDARPFRNDRGCGSA